MSSHRVSEGPGGMPEGVGRLSCTLGACVGSRGCALGQGRPHVPARVLGHRLSRVQCMSNASGTRLDVQCIGGGGEDDGVGAGGGDCISGRLRVVSWALGSGTRVRCSRCTYYHSACVELW